MVKYTLELVAIPVSDVDRAIAFYKQLGFNVDHDHQVNDELRFVQVTPPGSACSIAFGTGVHPGEPGSVQGLQVVTPDIEAADADLTARGIEHSEIDKQPWGEFIYFADPDGNKWSIQYIPYREN